MSIYGGDLLRDMVGAWFLSSPGVGGRVHNYAPQASALTQSAAVVHGIINNPYVGGPAGVAWRNQQDCITLETTDNASEATGTFVDLGDPIATGDDMTVLVGWIPVATTIPSGTGPGSMFVRGQDTFGNGWSVFLRHDGTDQISFATVLGGAQQSAIGGSAGLKPGIPNYAAGRVRQGSNVAVAVNGRFLTQTNTANTALRTSTKGCRLAVATGGGTTSHCDPLLFCVLWKRPLSDAELQFITAMPWVLWSAPPLFVSDIGFSLRPTVPIEFRMTEVLNEVLPIEWRGQISTGLPIEWQQALALIERTPVEWVLRLALMEVLPFESAGTVDLTLRWNVIVTLASPLLFMWNVLRQAAIFTLQIQWNVIAATAGLELTWNALPDVFTPFGVNPQTGEEIPPTPVAPGGIFDEDIQRPTAVTDKIP
jgi:hypothetical protein